jgi:coenzyme F420-0:L-glutamate ligase/coenzyme F420-1:gamma-L-glutamate ligase
MLSVLPVIGIPDVRPGDDLAELITAAAPWLEDGDVLVVTSKIVSKAEGNLAPIPSEDGPDRDAAKTAVLAGETARVVATRGGTRIVATHHGFVMAAGGIDESNVDRGQLVLLPKDPDAAARGLRSDLRTRFGLDVVVIVSDTMGRPWRNGLTDVALGVAGMEPILDYRGDRDAYGNELHITQMSPVDELCGAAELVKGKYDQVPVAVVRGLGIVGHPDGPGASVLIRSADTDMFSLGTAEARADGLRMATRLDRLVPPMPPVGTLDDAIRRAITAAGATVEWSRDGAVLTARTPVGGSAAGAGMGVHILRCSLAADGYPSSWRELDGVDLGTVTINP